MEIGEKELVKVGEDVDLPLTGALPFGIIDRGTSLLQVRPVSGCNLSCPFCSVDEGPEGKKAARYEVSLDYMVEYARAMAERKDSEELEMHIDGCGEPMFYPELTGLVRNLSRIEDVDVISMQTNGTLLDEEKIKELEIAGLDRINLTLNSLNKDLAQRLAGTEDYNLDEVMGSAEDVAKSSIDLLIAPVWIKDVNCDQIEEIIEYAKEIGAGERWPAVGIQKYREHRNGRKVEDAEEISEEEFSGKLREWENEYDIKLDLGPEDFGIEKTGFALPLVFERGERLSAKVMAQGWNPGQKLAVANHRTVTLMNGSSASIGQDVKLEILKNKHNLYIAKIL